MHPKNLTLDRYEPEVALVIDGLLFWLSVRRRNQTYGQRLLGIHYRNEHNVEFEQDRPRPTSRQKVIPPPLSPCWKNVLLPVF